MELPNEYQHIVDEFCTNTLYRDDAIRCAVERCYTLATKPPKELTESEIAKLIPLGWADYSAEIAFARAVIAAHIAKQSEPERVKFRAARCKRNHREIQVIPADGELNDHDWEWLEPEQSFEVVLP